MPDRATNGSTVLIALQTVLRGREEVASVEIAVSKELDQGSVELVCPTASDRTHHSAPAARKLGTLATGREAEFLYGVGIRKYVGDLR